MLAKWLKIETGGWVMKWLLLIFLLTSGGKALLSDGEETSQMPSILDQSSVLEHADSGLLVAAEETGKSSKTSCSNKGADNVGNCSKILSRTSDMQEDSVRASNSSNRTTAYIHVESTNRTRLDATESMSTKPTVVDVIRDLISRVDTSTPRSVLMSPNGNSKPKIMSTTPVQSAQSAPSVNSADQPTYPTSDVNQHSSRNGESDKNHHGSVMSGFSISDAIGSQEFGSGRRTTDSSASRQGNASPGNQERPREDVSKAGDLSRSCKNCSTPAQKVSDKLLPLSVPSSSTQDTKEKMPTNTKDPLVTTAKSTDAQLSHQNHLPKPFNATSVPDMASTQQPNTQNTTTIHSSNKTSNLPSPSKDTYPHQNDPPWHSGPNVGTDREKHPSTSNKNRVPHPKISKDTDTTIETSRPFVKLGPDWQAAKITWGSAWEFHIYFTGVLFVLLSVYSLVNILRLQSFMRLISHGYFLSLNFMIFLVCSIRAVYLLHDGYNSKNTYPMTLSYFLLTIPYPVLSSAFAVLFLALLQATKVQLLSPRIQKPTVLGAVILFYISFSTTTDILAGSFFGSQLLIFVCQVLFMTWSCTVSLAYFFIFRRLYIAALRKQGELIRITFTQMHIDGATLPKKLPKPTLGLAVKVALITAILELFMAALQVYGMIFVYGIFVPIKPDPWPWWAYQLTSRILEISMCCLMAFITTQPLRNTGGDIETGKCHRILLWMPCGSCAGGCCQSDSLDIEAFSSYCSRHRGFHNGGFHTSLDGSRRWDQTNSLPAFPTYSIDQDDPFTLKNIPTAGKSEIANNPSVGSLLSTFRSNRTVQAPVNTAEGSNTAQRGNQSTLASTFTDGRSTGSRPTSMLFKDKGFVRFRTEHDPEQPMDLSDDEEESSNSEDEMDSVRANASSSIPTLCEDDIVHSALSPFYYSGFHPRFHRMSRCSLETTDNSVEVSSDQLSNVTSRNGLSNSALDFHMRKYGSTCSSESAANSFDVTFFLHAGSNGMTPNHSSHVCRSELDDDTFVDPHDAALRSVSPLISRVRRVQQVPRDLNITPNSECCGQVNVACGTEDITPDSAVVMDVQFSEASGHSKPNASNDPSASMLHPNSPVDSPTCNKSSIISHSLNDLSYPTLRVSSSDSVLRTKRNSRSFLNRLKGSSFSLNASLNGYEPLECDGSGSSVYYDNSRRRKVQRSASDRQSSFSLGGQRPGLALGFHPQYEPLRQGHLREADSGMIRDCTDVTVCVDKASQTDSFLDTGRLNEQVKGIQCNLSKLSLTAVNRIVPPMAGNFPVVQEAL